MTGAVPMASRDPGVAAPPRRGHRLAIAAVALVCLATLVSINPGSTLIFLPLFGRVARYEVSAAGLAASCVGNESVRAWGATAGYVTVLLRGGLGNQLFMVGAALDYALRYRRCLVLPLEVSNPHRTGAPFGTTVLSRFWTDADPQRGPLARLGPPQDVYQPVEPYGFGELDVPRRRLVKLTGYFQHRRYQQDVRGLMRQLLAPPAASAAALASRYPGLATGVGLHVRRGDYLSYGDAYPVAGVSYYNRSTARLLRELAALGGDDPATTPTFFVFSNDFAWVRSQPFFGSLPGRVVYVDGEDEVSTLYMMSLLGGGLVCANSSFCWWGAYLGVPSRDARVTFPRPWFKGFPGVEHGDWRGLYYDGPAVVDMVEDGGSPAAGGPTT